MKRIHDIFEFMVSKEVLRYAFSLVKKKKNKKHKYHIKRFERNLDKNITKLHDALMAGTWEMHGYKHMMREEAGKMRDIYYSSDIGDLVVQCAVGITLGALLNKSLIEDTYAGIPKRSIQKAVKRIFRKVKAYGEKLIYGYKSDFRGFYLNIDHDELKFLLADKIKDKRVINFLNKHIDGYPTPKGLPIGNYISPILANFYLDTVDRAVKSLGVNYYRYNDDIIAFHTSKEKMYEVKDMIHQKADELKLQVKPNEQIFPIERFGFDFMGYIIQRNRVLVRRKIERHVRRNARKLKIKYTPHRAAGLSSRWGWFKRVKSGRNFWMNTVGCDIKDFKKFKEIVLCV